MSVMTLIHPDKVRAYMATDYRLGHLQTDIVLNIGKFSVPLAELFVESEVDCGAFLTAFNPFGTQQPDVLNEVAHEALVRRLTTEGVSIIEGFGGEPASAWPLEKSCFALGLGLEDARSIGVDFNQDAIVWIGPDAIPQLILLR